MKLVLFQFAADADPVPGILTDRGVVNATPALRPSYTPQLTMQIIIDHFDRLGPALERLAAEADARPLDAVRLLPPLPRPGKILCCIGNYWEHAQREPRPLNMFMKNPEAVIGPGDTIILPELTEPWIFMHEAELALVIKGPAKNVRRADWKKHVFGYTGLIDVSARGEGRRTWKAGSWLGKSFDTFAPIGPCIATGLGAEPRSVEGWVNGQRRQSSSTSHLIFPIEHLVEFITFVMTLEPGDIISTGTPEGIGPLTAGDSVTIKVEGVGELTNPVQDE
jgi:2-keto-4-pentenoate hydratase/2-oxohepta-3-ene-1,7-dioic acid hydratase in catechol pathway